MTKKSNENKLPWPPDAPDGKAWKCPDCGSMASLGENAGFHRDHYKHGEPNLINAPIEKASIDIPLAEYAALNAAFQAAEEVIKHCHCPHPDCSEHKRLQFANAADKWNEARAPLLALRGA